LFRRHVTELVSCVQDSGTQIILLTHANRFSRTMSDEDRMQLSAWRKFFPRASGECLLRMESIANESILMIGHEYGIPVVDIAHGVPATADDFADFAHFTDKGAYLVANEVVPTLLRIESRCDHKGPLGRNGGFRSGLEKHRMQ